MITDLNEPWKIIGMSREESGEVKIYYRGADTVECLATADVHDLINLCLEGGPL